MTNITCGMKIIYIEFNIVPNLCNLILNRQFLWSSSTTPLKIKGTKHDVMRYWGKCKNSLNIDMIFRDWYRLSILGSIEGRTGIR